MKLNGKIMGAVLVVAYILTIVAAASEHMFSVFSNIIWGAALIGIFFVVEKGEVRWKR